MATIKVRRGPQATLPTLEVGELAFTTDTRFLYVGSAAGNILIGPPSSEELVDAVMGAFATTDTITVTYNDPADSVFIDVRHQQSITSDPWGGIKLVGDSSTPGNNKVYGTDGSGNKGWQSPSAYTDEQACDAVANMLVQTEVDGYSSQLDWTYDDGNDHLWALLKLNCVSYGNIEQATGCSVVGRAANSTGDVGVITASSDGQVLMRGSNTVQFAQLNLGSTTGTLPVNRGGTNTTSYTTGDLLYASDSTTLSKLPKGTTGQVLTQGASVPAWDDVPNLTHHTETNGSATLGSDYTVTGSYGDSGLSITLPASGTYLVLGNFFHYCQVTAGQGAIDVRLYNTTDSAAVSNSDRRIAACTGQDLANWSSSSGSWIVTVEASKAIRVDAVRVSLSSPTWANSTIKATNSMLHYVKIA